MFYVVGVDTHIKTIKLCDFNQKYVVALYPNGSLAYSEFDVKLKNYVVAP